MIALCKLAFNTSARRELIKKCSQCCFNEKVKHRPKWAELLIAWIKPILQQIISVSHSSCCFILMSMLQDIRINSDQNRVHTSTRRVRKGYQWSRENWKCFPSQAIDLKSQNKQLSRRVKKKTLKNLLLKQFERRYVNWPRCGDPSITVTRSKTCWYARNKQAKELKRRLVSCKHQLGCLENLKL